MKRRHVYGPVPSRRLGLSLGVDPLPGKVCSYDCIYCQVGRTRELTTRRQEFFPPEELLAEVEARLHKGPPPDVITLAGSGEPTLYRPLGELIAGLHRLAPQTPIVLITNGSLLHEPEVAEAALQADVLIPSLDAGDEETYRRINRPHPAVPFGRMVQGLRDVAARHPGQVRMEVMLCAGVNDSEESLAAIARLLAGMKLDAIDINCPVRPVSDEQVEPCSPEVLESARRHLGERARAIGRFAGRSSMLPWARRKQELLELLARRPCTEEDIAAGLGISADQLPRLLQTTLAQGLVRAQHREGKTYYLVAERDAEQG